MSSARFSAAAATAATAVAGEGARRLVVRNFRLSLSPAPENFRRFCSNSKPSAAANAAGKRFQFVPWYLGMIESRPVVTKSITAGTIFFAADVSSQLITLESDGALDLMRTLCMASYGMLISGPTLHLWFNFVSKILPQRDIATTIKKLVMGQTVYSPIINTVFFSYNAALQGENTHEIVARLKRDLLPTLKSNVVYWPVCDFITFRFVPVHLQTLASNSFAFFWTIYLTYMAGLKKADVGRNASIKSSS